MEQSKKNIERNDENNCLICFHWGQLLDSKAKIEELPVVEAPPLILGGGLKITDQNDWGGPEQNIKFGGT